MNSKNKLSDEIKNLLETTILNESEIAEHLGCSRSYVNIVSNEFGFRKKLKEFILFRNNFLTDKNNFEGLLDEEIALISGLKLYRATMYRRMSNLKKVLPINITYRRSKLCTILFNDYIPGEKFIYFLKNCVLEMNEKSGQLISDFYITAKIEFLSKTFSDGGRSYITHARKELKNIISKYDIDDLVNQEILCKK